MNYHEKTSRYYFFLFFFLIITAIFFILSAQKVFAAIDTGIPCGTKQDCVDAGLKIQDFSSNYCCTDGSGNICNTRYDLICSSTTRTCAYITSQTESPIVLHGQCGACGCVNDACVVCPSSPTPAPSCGATCTYSQNCTTAGGQPGTQSCTGVTGSNSSNPTGACGYDTSGACAPNCSSCSASSCTPDGSCSAPTPSCGQTTFGTDNCGNSCSKTGPVCPSDASTCTSVTFNSSTITAGQNYTATIQMSNDGTTTWTSAANYKLGAQDPLDDPNWGTSTGADSGKGTRPTRVALPSSTSISPGSTGTFSFGVTAPDTAGDYRFAYQMLIEGVAWFGSRCGPNISVSPPCPSSIPAPTNLSPNGTTFPATTTSVTVSWNPVSGASRYAVRLRDNTINPSTTCGSSNVTCVDSVTGTSHTFNNLVAGHSYTWWVHAISSCDGIWSSPATANFSIDTSCAFSCGACPTKNTCGSTTYDTCADNLGQSGASLCTNGASGFRCYASANTSCQSAPPGTYNYACSACNVLTVQCSASSISASTGQSVTWTADPSGGSGTYTSYSWTGTDSLTGSTQSVSKTYSTVGTKYAGVTVTDSLGGTAQSPGYPNSCSVRIDSAIAPPAPTVSTPACIDPGYTGSGMTISWTNSGVTWVDMDRDSGFATPYYHKAVSAVFSTTGPSGFNADDGSGALSLNPDTTYFARTYDGTQNSGVTSFSIPACSVIPPPSCDLTINGSSSGTINAGVGTVFNMTASNPSTPYSISITGPSSTSFGPFSTNPSSATWNSSGYPAGSYSVSNGCTTRSVVLATSYRISGRIISDANKDACLTSTQGIPAVNVTATNLSNSQISTLPSDANGYYSFNTLISGNYSMAISNFIGKVVAVRIGGFWYSTGSPVVSPLTIPPNQTLDYCIDTSVPWLKTTSGDVHSNESINTRGGP